MKLFIVASVSRSSIDCRDQTCLSQKWPGIRRVGRVQLSDYRVALWCNNTASDWRSESHELDSRPLICLPHNDSGQLVHTCVCNWHNAASFVNGRSSATLSQSVDNGYDYVLQDRASDVIGIFFISRKCCFCNVALGPCPIFGRRKMHLHGGVLEYFDQVADNPHSDSGGPRPV